MELRLVSTLFKKMIKGHGIDIEEISSIQKVYEKNARFAKKVLTAAEFDRFEKLTGKRKMEYLAGRWSAKEAFSKAWGTGIGCVTFQDLEILNPLFLARSGYRSAMQVILLQLV